MNNNLAGEVDKNYQYHHQLHTYLQFEDFTCRGLGLETYQDGRQHPVELRRMLTGDLSREMSVSFRDHNNENFQALIHPHVVGSRLMDFYPPASFDANLITSSPFKVGGGRLRTRRRRRRRLFPDKEDVDKEEEIITPPPARRRGRPAGQQGTFDAESGTIRFVCRLQCGASLASAKGRRKHEKKHCPHLSRPSSSASSSVLVLPSHSLFSRVVRVPLKLQRRFECRVCGKVLKTYEGRRLHEKLQHLSRRQMVATTTAKSGGGDKSSTAVAATGSNAASGEQELQEGVTVDSGDGRHQLKKSIQGV